MTTVFNKEMDITLKETSEGIEVTFSSNCNSRVRFMILWY